MKKQFLLTTYHKTLGKYRKYHNRLVKNINNGSFQNLSITKRNSLTTMVEGLRLRLENLQPKIAALAAAGMISLTMATTNISAQPFVHINDINLLGTADVPSPLVASGNYFTLSFVDLDNDGDKDVIASNYDYNAYNGGSSFRYFKNTGTNSVPVYDEQTGSNSPLDSLSVGSTYSSISSADMDGDGDFDLMAGADGNALFYFKNIGTVTAPVFESQTGTNSFFDNLTFYGFYDELYPFPVDIDNDGDKDFFMSDEDYGKIGFYLNTGTSTAPSMMQLTGTSNPFDTISFGFRARACFADIDNDGDQDAMIAEYSNNNKIFFYKNIGTSSVAVFAEQSGTNNPFETGTLDDGGASVSFADLDYDGDFDMFVSGYGIQYFENAGTASAPYFPGFMNPQTIGFFGYLASPSLVDLDNDGDEDMSIGNAYGSVLYYKNTGTNSAPLYAEQTGTNNPLGVASGISQYYAPSFVDIDNDGDMDLMLGTYYDGYSGIFGRIEYFKNTGTASAASFIQQTGSANPLDTAVFMYIANPTFSDLDNDGDMDLVVGDFSGSLNYFKNTGTNTAAIFAPQTGTDNPLDTLAISGSFSSPEFTDFDFDGDQDLLIGSYYGNLNYYKNTGSASTAVYSPQTGTDSPFDGIIQDNISAPTLDDVDNDGDIDLFFGDQQGKIYFYQNTKFMAGIGKISISEKLSAFPNPTNGTLNIVIPSSLEGNASISIMDLSGRTVYNEKKQLLEGIITIDALKEAEKGMYILHISTDSQTATTKVVKD